jgi:hypothetical protein
MSLWHSNNSQIPMQAGYWLRRTDSPVFEMGSMLWRPYRQGLVPASLKPAPVQLTPRQERELLQKSGSLFLRYFTRVSSEPTGFWYTVCDEYNPRKSAKSELRRRIRRAYEQCTVRTIEAAWLAQNGYECYAAAFSRYRNSRPIAKDKFQAVCLGSVGGPFEFWGVFVAGKLAGFAKCAIESDYVAVLVSKLDPAYLSLFSAYALRDTLLQTYVAEQGKTVGDGFRSIVHQSAMHDFLLKFGYRRMYCDLRVIYKPFVRAFVALAYPFRALVDKFPSVEPALSAQALLAQEAIRRSFG